jgi:hypothetical protein
VNNTILLLLIILSNLVFAQNEVEEMRYYTFDLGSWIGVHIGLQTNGGDFSERYVGSVTYDYRFAKTFLFHLNFRYLSIVQ